jgi:hypothetical protein
VESNIHACRLSRSVATAVLVAIAVLVIGFPSLYLPFGRDQGIHAFIAELAGDGLVLYRDIYNVKPPLTTLVHWLSQILFGENMRAIRIMDLLFVAATALMLLFLAARHLRSLGVGAVAAVAYAAFHFSNDYWSTAQTDGWTSAFTVASMLFYSRSLDTPRRGISLVLLLATGFAVGLSFWLKYTSMLVLGIFLAAHLALRYSWRRVLADGLAVAGGFLSCLGLGFAVLAVQGALDPFLDSQNFVRSYVAVPHALAKYLPIWLNALVSAKLAIALAVVGVGVIGKAAATGKLRPGSVALLAWLAAGLGAGLVQGKGFPYHLLPVYPPLAIAAAVGWRAILAMLPRFGGDERRASIMPAICLLIIWFSQTPANYRDLMPVMLGDGPAIRAYWNSIGSDHPDSSVSDNLALADYLTRETLPCDSVYIWGFEPAVYFLAQRRPVTRFVYNFPMFTAYYRQSYRDEFMAGIAANPPSTFVVEHEDRSPEVSIHNHDSAEILRQFDALKTFLAASYRWRDRIARFEIYFRRDIEPGAARSCPN